MIFHMGFCYHRFKSAQITPSLILAPVSDSVYREGSLINPHPIQGTKQMKIDTLIKGKYQN